MYIVLFPCEMLKSDVEQQQAYPRQEEGVTTILISTPLGLIMRRLGKDYPQESKYTLLLVPLSNLKIPRRKCQVLSQDKDSILKSSQKISIFVIFQSILLKLTHGMYD